MFITKQRIITMRRNRVKAVQDVHDELMASRRPATVGEFFVAVVDRITERIGEVVEDIDAARERALITQEELNSRLSEQMNRAMYTLSIVAAIFLPLGLLTGLLGINGGGIPGTESPWAFLVVTVLLLALAIVLIAWFRKIKWL
jgi:zinc transporter